MKSLKRIRATAFLLLLAATIGISTFWSSRHYWIPHLRFAARHADLTYGQKMRWRWGTVFYDYLCRVRDDTPSEAVIAHPPMQEPWLRTGNLGLCYYFLRPRKLLHWTDPEIAPRPSPTHVLIVGHDDEPSADARLWPSAEILSTSTSVHYYLGFRRAWGLAKRDREPQ